MKNINRKTQQIYLITIPFFIFWFSINTSFIAFGQTIAQKIKITAKNNSIILKQLAGTMESEAIQNKQIAEQWAQNNGYPVSGVTNGFFFEILKLDDTSGMPVYYISDNDTSAKTISTNKVRPGGSSGLNLTGANMTIGVWDNPIVDLSQYSVFSKELGDRLIQIDKSVLSTAIFPHPLHVAGTIIATGVNPRARGMANQARIRLYNSLTSESKMATEAGDSGLLFSNHSYSISRGWIRNDFGKGYGWYWHGTKSVNTNEDYQFGFYDAYSRNWDEIAYNAPYYLIVKSAGNYRLDGPTSGTSHWDYNYSTHQYESATDNHGINGGATGYDCLDQKGVAKNILTVGAIDDIPNGYTSKSDVHQNRTYFSSWGPTDDGRIKPDIVASGDCVYSLWSGLNADFGCGTCNGQEYCSMSGTSQSAPSVTGSLALLQQYFSNTHEDSLGKVDSLFMLASTLKALVIHTADEAGPTGPDYMYSWGLMNTQKAANLIQKNNFLKNNIHELTLHGGRVYIAEFTYDSAYSRVPYIKITMAWTDPPGTPVTPQLNPRTPMLVHDLDMVMYTTGQNWGYLPYVLDPANPSATAIHSHNKRDNVEQIYMTSPVNGKKYTLVINKDTRNYSPPKGIIKRILTIG